MRRVAVLVLFFVAACGSFGAAQPHTLSLAYKAGDTYKYKFHSTSKQTAGTGGMTIPVSVDTSANETVAVKSVDSSGVADLSITLSDFSLKTVAAGVTNTTTGLPANSVEVKIRPDGTLVSVNGNDLMAGSPIAALAGVGGGYFIAAVLPDKAVKVGDTWSKTYDQKDPIGSGTVHIVSDSKYLRDESFNGVTAAVVETKSTSTLDLSGPTQGTPGAMSGVSVKGTFTTDVMTWIDPNGHRVLKSHSTAQDDLTINLPTTSTNKSSSPVMQGPLTAKGETTSDLAPA